MAKFPIEVTPLGVAGYSKYLYERDTKFAKSEEKAKYNMKFLLPKDQMGTLMAALDGGKTPITGEEWMAHINELHMQGGGKDGEGPIKDGDKITDKEGKTYDANVGMWVITLKSGYQPKTVDTKKQDLPANVKIFGGDAVKCAIRPELYDGFGGGVTLYLNAVMLIEKNGGGSADAFGEEEGYVAEASAADAFGGDANGPEQRGADNNNGDY